MMSQDDIRLEILDKARQLLVEDNQASPAESEEILKLLKVLTVAIERNAGGNGSVQATHPFAANAVLQLLSLQAVPLH